MAGRLAGKTCLITAAANGIGKPAAGGRAEPRFAAPAKPPIERQAAFRGKLHFMEDVAATFDEFDRLHAAEFGAAAAAARV